ncbi:MAG: quinolinate synthase NadA [Pseudomonadota bacterium]|nr:quinolinate synthase NadA [Pseudomonadota bacterium]
MFLIQSTVNMEASSRFLNQSLIERHRDSLNKVEGPANKDDLFESITHNLKKNKATVVSHYYVDPLIQEITEKTGGFVGDSLEMAKFGNRCKSENLIVCGVKFMAETAKILSPEKSIFVPTLESTCSLDLGCPADELKELKNKHPERELVVYANTSAEVKAMSDWVVTSSIAKEIIEDLHFEGKKILWAPDKYLGSYLQKETGADMILWDSACVVHEEFKSNGIKDLKALHPDAGVLVHPESPPEVIEMADAVGSTSHLIKASKELDFDKFIVATDKSIFYKMSQFSPNKEFFEAPTGGVGSSCKSCAHCPWMGLNSLYNLDKCVLELNNEIQLDESLIKSAKEPLDKMIQFNA